MKSIAHAQEHSYDVISLCLGVGLECAVQWLKTMKIQPDFCVLVLLMFYHQRRSLAQLIVDILKFEDNQKALDKSYYCCVI